MKRLNIALVVILTASQSLAATQSSYPTKTSPVSGDKALITDSEDSNKTKQATFGSLPISTATQAALNLKETKAVVQSSAPADTTVDWYDTDQEDGVLILKRHNGTTWIRASSHGVQYATSCSGITGGMCVDTDDGKLYYHNGTEVVEVASGGSYTLPTASADTLGGVKIGNRLTITNGVLSADVQSGTGAVDSVNSQTGTVVLDADDIDDTSTTNKFVTATDITKLGNTSGTNTGDQDISGKANVSCFASESAFNACFALTWPTGSSMVYPGAGVPNSTGSAWGTSYTVGTSANNLVQLNSSAQLPAVSAALLTNFPTLNQSTTGTAGGLSGTPDITVGALIASSISTTSTAAASAVFGESEANGGTYAVTLTVGDLSANKTVYGEHILQTTDVVDTPTDGSSAPASSNSLFDGLALKSNTTHNHTGVYEPADSNIIKSAEIDTSGELRGVLTDEVGTGAAYFVGGALGTPASAILTNATGLPAAGLALEPTAISSTQTLSSLNGYYTITGEYTVTLPARSAGAWGCFQTVGANVATIDVNASDNIMLDGTALADGTAIVSDGTTGKTICIQSRGADGWITWGNNGWASE